MFTLARLVVSLVVAELVPNLAVFSVYIHAEKLAWAGLACEVLYQFTIHALNAQSKA